MQNRVNRALPRLPEIVRQIGVTTEKSSPNLTMVVHLVSPDNRYDALYLRNYAALNVRDQLLRIPGIGHRAHLRLGRLCDAHLARPAASWPRADLTSADVVKALREQNAQVAAGVVGAPPSPDRTDFQLAVNTQGRLQHRGGVRRRHRQRRHRRRLAACASRTSAASSWARTPTRCGSLLNNKEAAAIGIFQAPNSNALAAVRAQVRATMDELKKDFPPGVDYAIVYDPTRFVRTSIEKVVATLIEAILLVVLVVVVFLQTWRASIIPLLAVPVSIVGTFAVLLALGFSINTLTLFGLVLSIGIVVDDAIVVVENVERNIEAGLTPARRRGQGDAGGQRARSSRSAWCCARCSCRWPSSAGLEGQFYRQFAVTIAISTVISAFNSLTLSPALAAILLRSRTTRRRTG